jgi:ribosome-associated protein
VGYLLSEIAKEKLISEFVFTASRSSGPGGQNVNKVNTRVELRFSIESSVVFSELEKFRLKERLKNRINSVGELVLASETERTQLSNKEKVTEKCFALIEKALTLRKKRIRTKPTISSQLERLKSKKIKGQKKQLRQPPASD